MALLGPAALLGAGPWEDALLSLKEAEIKLGQDESTALALPGTPLLGGELPPELKVRFQDIGRHLPDLWMSGQINQTHKKALLRCLMAPRTGHF